MFLRICIALLLVTGCGGTPSAELGAGRVQGVPNGTWKQSASNRHALAGAWRSDCLESGQASKKIETRIFDDRTLVLVFYFNDRRCSDADFEQGIVVRGQPLPESDGTWNLEASEAGIQDGFLVANSAVASKRMSASEMCGTQRWALNKARSVFGTPCFPKGTTLGTYRFEQSRDPRFVKIQFPHDGLSAWLWNRL